MRLFVIVYVQDDKILAQLFETPILLILVRPSKLLRPTSSSLTIFFLFLYIHIVFISVVFFIVIVGHDSDVTFILPSLLLILPCRSFGAPPPPSPPPPPPLFSGSCLSLSLSFSLLHYSTHSRATENRLYDIILLLRWTLSLSPSRFLAFSLSRIRINNWFYSTLIYSLSNKTHELSLFFFFPHPGATHSLHLTLIPDRVSVSVFAFALSLSLIHAEILEESTNK